MPVFIMMETDLDHSTASEQKTIDSRSLIIESLGSAVSDLQIDQQNDGLHRVTFAVTGNSAISVYKINAFKWQKNKKRQNTTIEHFLSGSKIPHIRSAGSK